jgi:hypothetical protein
MNNIGILVELKTDYAVVCETLERIGVLNKKTRVMYPSCYCHKFALESGITEYRICHFKEMFTLEGKPSTFDSTDRLRLKTITYFLHKWNLIKVVNTDDVVPLMKNRVDVIPYTDKSQYKIVHKYKKST